MEGAKTCALSSIAVTYGYAPEGELEAAGPDWLVHSVPGVEALPAAGIKKRLRIAQRLRGLSFLFKIVMHRHNAGFMSRRTEACCRAEMALRIMS